METILEIHSNHSISYMSRYVQKKRKCNRQVEDLVQTMISIEQIRLSQRVLKVGLVTTFSWVAWVKIRRSLGPHTHDPSLP